MALSQDFKTQAFGQEVIIKDSYIRVNSVYWDKHHANTFVDICDKESKATLNNIQYSFDATLEGKNFVAQVYDYLKTLPEFADAIDC
jgi:hypothetical protein